MNIGVSRSVRFGLGVGIPILMVAGGVPAAVASPQPSTAPSAQVTSARTSAAERRLVDRVKTPKVSWHRITGKRAYLGTASVPLDYNHPNGRQVTLALAKVPATAPSKKIGTLFLNPGGPGGSGVDLALNANRLLSREVLSRFDIVGFDPRGTNGSDPVRCFATDRSAAPVLEALRGFPVGKSERKRFLAAARKLADGCSHYGRRLASAMSTTEVARDMELLRRSVGDAKLSYLGFSYGSYLGEMYANLYPDRFRAIAIDGVVDPAAWRGSRAKAAVPTSLRLKSAEGSWKALSKALELCRAAGPEYCPLADPTSTLRSVMASLRKAPLQTPTGTVSYADLVNALLGTLYFQTGGPEQAVALLGSVQDALKGDAVAATASSHLLKKLEHRRASLAARYDNSVDASSAVLCSDTAEPRLPSVWQPQITQRAKTAPYFAEGWGWIDVQCARKYWTAADEDRYRGSFSRHTAPVLIVGNYQDPATAYTAAVSTHRRMPNSWLLSSDSWGHTAYRTSQCVTGQVDAYLLDGTKPAEAVCQGDYVPFSTPLSAEAPRTSMSVAAASAMGPRR